MEEQYLILYHENINSPMKMVFASNEADYIKVLAHTKENFIFVYSIKGIELERMKPSKAFIIPDKFTAIDKLSEPILRYPR